MTLPILVVETAHSRYEIDQNEGVYRRTRVHPEANDLSRWGVGDGVAVEYDDILLSSLHEGGHVVITHADGTWVHSTEVQSITEIPVADAA